MVTSLGRTLRAVAYDGEFFCVASGDQTTIVSADPQISIGEEIFDLLLHGYGGGFATLDLRGAGPTDRPGRFTGAVLTLDGTNRRVVYRIGRYLPGSGRYEAEWPD